MLGLMPLKTRRTGNSEDKDIGRDPLQSRLAVGLETAGSILMR